MTGDKPTMTGDKLPIYREMILEFIEKNGLIRNHEVRQITGLAASRTREVLQKLVKDTVIEAIGTGKGRYYILNKTKRSKK